jgi:hypothetical protein
MYEGTKEKVLSQDGETELFNILAGVLQGNLFAIMINYCMREAVNGDNVKLDSHLYLSTGKVGK